MLQILKRFLQRAPDAVTRARARRRCGWLRFPATAEEARSIWRRWDRLNGRYYYVADVRLQTGETVPHVVFDSDTNVAVSVHGGRVELSPSLLGAAIVACQITKVPGRNEQTHIPCVNCGSLLTVEEVMNACSPYDTPFDCVTFVCPKCSERSELQIRTGELLFGHVSAAGSPHFEATFTVLVPGLSRPIGEVPG